MWRYSVALLFAAVWWSQSSHAADVRCQTSATYLQYIIHSDLGGGHYDTSFAALGTPPPAIGVQIALTSAGGVLRNLGVACPNAGDMVLMSQGSYQMLIDAAGVRDELVIASGKLDGISSTLSGLNVAVSTGIAPDMQTASLELWNLQENGLALLIGVLLIGSFAVGYRFANRGGDV